MTPATDSYLELALAYAIESVLLEGGSYCQVVGGLSRKERVIIEHPPDQFCGYSGFLVQPVLSSLPVIGPLAAPA